MSFNAVSGVSLKLYRLFLKICKWVLVKMSLNCKLSGLKWRRIVLFMWVLVVVVLGLLGFLFSSNNRSLGKQVDFPDSCEHKAQILLQNFNVCKEEFHALASLFFESDQITSSRCGNESGYEIPPNNIIACALKMVSSEDRRFEKQHKVAAENVEPKDQCHIRDENILGKLDPSLLGDSSISLNHQSHEEGFHQNVSRPGIHASVAPEHCESISFCFVKVCWWILIGMVVNCKMSGLHGKLWRNRKQKLVLQQRLTQMQQQPLTQMQQQQQPRTQMQQQHEQTQSSSGSAGKWRKTLLFIFVLAGVIGSFWLCWYLNKDIVLRRKETLENMCDERARMLQDQFNVSMNHVHALAILVSTFHHGKQPSAIDQKTFGEYTERTAFERPLTSGVAYALRVPHSEREQFEKQHGWTIKKMETEDQTVVQDYIQENLDPAPLQDEYAPVIFSQETVSHIVSIDMMSGKEDRENILRARASGKGVLTSPFKLLKSNHLGVVLTFAVYNTQLSPDAMPEQRLNATVGYLGASYDVPSLVEKLLHQLASKQTIVVNVYDTTNKSAPINMYGTDVIDTGLLQISNLDFGDPTRKHEMHCRFKQKPSPPWTAITAFVGVLVITLLVGHIFHAAINRIAKVEHDFRKMEELKHRAEAADIAKSQFLATVSHEIRTPMNGVLGMLQMLMDTNLDTNQLDYAQTAHASGKELISLINEVLDQAKIESGRLELEAVPFDLRAVLDNVLSLYSVKSYEKGIELAVYVSSQVPWVVIGDPGRFRQIITNLVGNSIKFTHDKGHIFVSVHLADEVRQPLDVRDEVLRQNSNLVQDHANTFYNTLSGFPVVNRWKSWENFKNLSGMDSRKEIGMIKLLVTVEDTGVGIPPEARSHIFTPFMQADSSTSRMYGGTGIGLSISQRLVNLMHGEIGFVSEPGTGSTFSFTAAFTKAEMSSLDTKWQQLNSSVSGFQGVRALVVDGKGLRAEVTRYHLERLGILVDISLNMDAACSYLSCYSQTSASENLAAVLVDKDIWNKETGVTLQHQLKELRPSGCTKVPEVLPKIFLIATCISSDERNELKSSGLVANVLTKPLRLSVLISCFQEATGIGKKRQVTTGIQSTLGNLLKDKQILVVDDNVVNRRVAEGALKKFGAFVTCVASGKAALTLLKPPHTFDACFMDIQMPEMDGFEATRKIRSLESKFNEKMDSGEVSNDMYGHVAHWHTPIVAMTADVIQATNEKCMKCGMDDYVSKPFDEVQLYSAVARVFESG